MFRLLLFFFYVCFCCSSSANENSIQYLVDFNEGLEVSKAKDLNLLVIWGSESCKYCKKMKVILNSTEFSEFKDKFVFVYLDINKNFDHIKQFDVIGTPHLILLNHKAEKLRESLGELDRDSFLALLRAWSLKEISKSDLIVSNNNYVNLQWKPDGYRGESICYSNVGYGPLRLSTQSPFQSLRYNFEPRTTGNLLQGQLEFHVHDTWVNIWANQEDDYFMDFETNSILFYAGYGLSDTMQIEIQYENRSRFGGYMDGFIQGFHDTFGIDQSGRTDVGKEGFAVDFVEKDGFPAVHLDSSDMGIYNHNLNMTLQHNITCGTFYVPAISYSFTVGQSLYNKDKLRGKIELDLNASLSVSKRYKEFFGYQSFGLTVFGRNRLSVGDDEIVLRRSQFSSLTAVEWKFRKNMGLSLQYLITQGAISNRFPFNRFSHEITLGYSWEFKENYLFQFGLIENMFVPDNSPDLGIFSGITFRM